MNSLRCWRHQRRWLPRSLRNTLGRWQGFSGCGRCRNTWNWTEEHATPYKPGHACFPLCQHCWQQLTPQQRLPYYMQLHDRWLRNAQQRHDWDHWHQTFTEWPNIKTAVLQGL